ncbi:MAG: hypothetical protein ACJAWL_003235 [Motiliproteus sp.]|jgi:hypothetical protein
MKYLIIALAAALATFSVAANQVPAEAPIEASMTAAEEQQAFGEQHAETVKKAKKTGKTVKNDIKEYMREVSAQLIQAKRSHSVTLVSGTAQVSVTKEHSMWSHHRANALRQATLNAKESYLSKLNTSVRNEVVNSLFNDAGAPRPSPEDFKSESGMASIRDKAVALMEVKLDSELSEAGIDPNLFADSSPSQKQQIMRKYFAEKTLTSAFGDLSGMFVIKTFESYTDDGKGTIGVVMARSAKKRDQIKALVESRGQVKPDPAKANPDNANLAAVLAADEAPYLQYGTALDYDEQGYPLIISFGQAGVQYTDDDVMLSIQIEAATSEAESNAMANLAQTYNMSGDFSKKVTKESDQGKELVHTLTSSSSVSTTDPGVVIAIRNILDQSSRMSASISGLNGLRTLNAWEMEHPITGHLMVGVAVVWHPVQVRNAELMQSGRSAADIDAAQKQKQGPQKVSSQQSTSRFNSDF